MYSFLVVDDEKHIRQHVSAILREIGASEVYQAENGAGALSLIKTHPVDAIIVDIMMPVLNGFDFLRELRAQKDATLVAILSGYDEFEFAQRAMSYDVLDYLLKPIDTVKVRELYFKIVRYLRGRENIEIEISRLTERADKMLPFIRQRFFEDWVKGRLNLQNFAEMCAYLNLDFGRRPAQVFLLEIENSLGSSLTGQSNESLSAYSLLEVIMKIVQQWRWCESFFTSDHAVAVVWSPPDGLNKETAIPYTQIELLMDEMKSLYNESMNVGVGRIVSDPLEIGLSFNSAVLALRNKLIYGAGNILESEPTDISHKENLKLIATPILENIWLGKKEAAQQGIVDMIATIEKKRDTLNLTSIRFFYKRLLVDCLAILEEEHDLLFAFCQRQDNDLLDVRFADYSLEETSKFFQDLVGQICDEIVNNRNNKHQQTVVRVKQIIAEQYAQNITLADLAQKLHFSKSYFGQIFKAETGLTITEYINFYRIQKAKELLATKKYLIYEVAEKVGFSDQAYFSRIFKKIVGCIPSEYRA